MLPLLIFSSIAVPLVVFTISYLILVRAHGTWSLWDENIHESGRYTLGGTVFYWNHFLREVPIDILYCLCIFWSWQTFLANSQASLPSGLKCGFLIALVLFMLIVVAFSFKKVGLRSSLLDFAQYRELDTIENYGSHWNLHFLSTIATMAMMLIPGAFFNNSNNTALMTIGAVFAFFSIVFVTRKKAFISPRWILHGGREIFTFFFLGFLPAFVPLLVVAVGDGTVYEIEIDALALIPIFVLGAVSAYSLWVLATNNLSELAQGGHGPAYLLASHFFEHSLDLIFMYLLLLYLIFP